MFRGPVTARAALQASLNLPVVALTEALGPARLLAAMRQAGVEAVVPGDTPGLAVALGGVGVSPEGLVQLYAAIARGGEARGLSVVPGDVVDSALRLMTAEAAWHVGDVLAEAPRPAELPDWPLAFKTGTSSGHRDALALGFDGAHVVGVWVGRADGTPVPGMYGVEVAALAPLAGGIPARVERGTAPFTWFADRAPMVVGSYEREAQLELLGPGFVTMSVVDADGRGARVRVEVR